MRPDHPNGGPHRSPGGCPHARRPEQGWLRILFLRLIHENPMHGYQVMEETNRMGLTEASTLEPGTVYTLLRRMEHHGLVTSEWQEAESGPDRRVYTVTPAGEAFLREGIRSLAQRKKVLDELVAYHDARLREGQPRGQ